MDIGQNMTLKLEELLAKRAATPEEKKERALMKVAWQICSKNK